MSYMHIENLYRPSAQQILEFKTVFVLEKIHGTSAHIFWREGELKFFSGGANHKAFADLFDHDALISAFRTLDSRDFVVYGEAYGGKVQGMSKVYGKDLKFVAFEVKIDGLWLAVPQARDIASKLGLDFVDFDRSSTKLEELNAHREAPSSQALRNGMGIHPREGIVIRPPFEVTLNSGSRLIAKYKTAAYQERTREPKVGEAIEITELTQTADDWVTPMRLQHVLDTLHAEGRTAADITQTGDVIKAMHEDIQREGSGELDFTRPLMQAIGRRTASLFKDYLQRKLEEHND